jgi:hypothetical protein
MSHAFAYAMLLIHLRQAHDLTQQQELQRLFLIFLAGELTAEQYERELELKAK